jgi:hypothetical protein
MERGVALVIFPKAFSKPTVSMLIAGYIANGTALYKDSPVSKFSIV